MALPQQNVVILRILLSIKYIILLAWIEGRGGTNRENLCQVGYRVRKL